MGSKQCVMYHHELEPSERPSEGVYMTVAAVDDSTPDALPPLAKTINPDALNAVVESAQTNLRQVVFRYSDYEVTVTTEEICVEAHERSRDRPQ